MRRLREVAMVLGLTVVAAGCAGGGTDDDIDEPAPTTAAAAAPTTVPAPSTTAGSTAPAANLTLRITDVRLVNSEESDSGMRVLLPAGVVSASVTLTGVPSPNRVISVCQARVLDQRLNSAVCRTPANGEAVTVALGAAASGIEVVQVGVSGTGPEANTTALDEITVRYGASSRQIEVRLPQIAGDDAGGRPTFGLTPPSADGAYRAALTWKVIQVFGGTISSGRLEVLKGGVATGEAQSGSADVRLTGTLSPPGADAVVRVQNAGASALVSPTLSALLP